MAAEATKSFLSPLEENQELQTKVAFLTSELKAAQAEIRRQEKEYSRLEQLLGRARLWHGKSVVARADAYKELVALKIPFIKTQEQLHAIQHSKAYQLALFLREVKDREELSALPKRFFRLVAYLFSPSRGDSEDGLSNTLVAPSASEIQARLEVAELEHGAEGVHDLAERLISQYPESRFPRVEERVCRSSFDILKAAEQVQEALPYARRALQLYPENEKLVRALVEISEKTLRDRDFVTTHEIAVTLRDGLQLQRELPTLAEYLAFSRDGICVPPFQFDQEGELYSPPLFGLTRNELVETYEGEGAAAVEALIGRVFGDGRLSEQQIQVLALRSLMNASLETGFRYGSEIPTEEHTVTFAKLLSDIALKLGKLSVSLEVLAPVGGSEEFPYRYEMMEGQLQLLREGYAGGGASVAYEPERGSGSTKEGRILYFLHNSLPYSSGGYATRTHGLLSAVTAHGRDIRGITRWGFPLDRLKGKRDEARRSFPPETVVGDVPYLCMAGHEGRHGSIPLPDYLTLYEQRALLRIFEQRPVLLHAASNFMNGVVANSLARRLQIPSVYEVRGLWEVTRMSRQPEWKDSEHFSLQVKMETQAAADATAVIAITTALKDEMVARGIPREKITVIPNGVDTTRFVPLYRDEAFAEQLGCRGKTVIGYIGSVVDYEGLELLIEAASLLQSEKDAFRVLVVGDGDALPAVKAKAEELGLGDTVIFTGRVPHEEVEQYYRLTDVLAYPRRGLPVCEMVSPMKPFEAMAMQKAVLSSDVAALAEIVQDGVTGLLHRKDDVEHLASQLRVLIHSPERCQQLGEAAREWVVEYRDWKTLGGELEALYERTLKSFFLKESAER